MMQPCASAVNRHVGRFDPDAGHLHQQAHHGRRTRRWRVLQALQPGPFDGRDLVMDQPQAHYFAALIECLAARVAERRLALARSSEAVRVF
ncbi:hypothetical protein [Azospirillum argentinense]